MSDVRTRGIRVAVSDAEFARLGEAAQAAGVNRATYLRIAGLAAVGHGLVVGQPANHARRETVGNEQRNDA